MKKTMLFLCLACLSVTLSAQVPMLESPHVASVGVHGYYHIFDRAEDISGAQYFFLCTRLGAEFNYSYYYAPQAGLGVELLLDSDVVTFLNSALGSSEDTGFIEPGIRLLFNYRTPVLTFTPFIGARALLIFGYNLEGGLRLSLPVNPKIELDLEGSYLFGGKGDLYYVPHGSVALGIRTKF